MILTITKDNFEEEVLEAQGKVLVDFWAVWCGACTMLSPIIDEIAEETDNVKICKVDCDHDRELAIEHGINAIPTILVFENGEIITRSTGYAEKQDILNMLK